MKYSDIHIGGFTVAADSSLATFKKPSTIEILDGRVSVPQMLPDLRMMTFPAAITPPYFIGFDLHHQPRFVGVDMREVMDLTFRSFEKGLNNGFDPVLHGSGMKHIVVVLRWPGYAGYSVERIINAVQAGGRPLSRARLLTAVSELSVHQREMIASGAPEWDLFEVIDPGQVHLVGIKHVIGNVYVPELHVDVATHT
ncbi:hypothetical protein B0H21DRAFT_764975 [Amylocystis lapponica]|nr:hypothetical protein B0H21DRAFT_764975 [Amylocystis lapponica]